MIEYPTLFALSKFADEPPVRCLRLSFSNNDWTCRVYSAKGSIVPRIPMDSDKKFNIYINRFIHGGKHNIFDSTPAYVAAKPMLQFLFDSTYPDSEVRKIAAHLIVSKCVLYRVLITIFPEIFEKAAAL